MKVTKGELKTGRFIVPYRIYGEAAQTMVCISGAKQTMAAWRSFVSFFIKDYRLVVFDMPGQGRAKISGGLPEVKFDEQVDVLANIISCCNRDGPVILAAASWGTIVSVAYAARYPQMVDKMILGSFCSKPSRAVLEVIDAGQTLFDNNDTGQIAPLMIETFGQYIPDAHKKQMLEQFGNMTDEQFISFYKHCEFVKQTEDLGRFVDLKDIEAETLIVVGEYDSLIDQADVTEAATLIADSELVVVPGAGHFLHWEKPEILHVYKEFLEEEQLITTNQRFG